MWVIDNQKATVKSNLMVAFCYIDFIKVMV